MSAGTAAARPRASSLFHWSAGDDRSSAKIRMSSPQLHCLGLLSSSPRACGPPNHRKLAGSRRRRDNVKEAARNHAAPATGRRGVTAIRIGDEGERRVVSEGLDARIVELVPAQLRPSRAKTAAIDKANAAIAEMQSPPGKAGRYAQ